MVATFRITNVQIPSPIFPNTGVGIVVSVSNVGDTLGTALINIRKPPGGSVIAQKQATIGFGLTGKQSFFIDVGTTPVDFEVEVEDANTLATHDRTTRTLTPSVVNVSPVTTTTVGGTTSDVAPSLRTEQNLQTLSSAEILRLQEQEQKIKFLEEQIRQQQQQVQQPTRAPAPRINIGDIIFWGGIFGLGAAAILFATGRGQVIRRIVGMRR